MELVATGLEFSSYGIEPKHFREAYGVTLVECPVESMPLPKANSTLWS